MLLPLVILQRLLHREIQVVTLLITRNIQLTLAIFSILFFPGVLLHETSHFLMAKILRVKTGKFSVIPKPLSNGRLQMGYVEVEQTDFIRDSLIGLAPLIAGTLFIAYAGIAQLHLNTLWNVLQNGQVELFWMGVGLLPAISDFWLWFYLTIVVSSTMMPSESDRHAWLPLGIWIGVLFTLAILSGFGTWMLYNLAPFFDNLLNSVALLFGLSNLVHIVLLFPFFVLHRLLVYIMKVDVK
ncbi:MAG TPA: hypothetical protein DIW23_01400 [Anaerolineae bacterium]|nr:hypothetical protein [Anaerolineae bacterium]HRJ75080.1 hypothetical protein [Anaerolineales bacterium]